MNYGELKAAVAGYLHDTTLTTEIIEFISRTEERIGGSLRIIENRLQSTETPVAGKVTLPTRYVEINRISSGTGPTYRVLQSIDPREAGDFESLTGSPVVYYITDAIYLLPASTGDVVIDYYERPEPLVGDVDGATRPIMDRYANIYLDGALAEASKYLRDFTSAQGFTEQFEAGIKRANWAAQLNDHPRAYTHHRLRGRSVPAP